MTRRYLGWFLLSLLPACLCTESGQCQFRPLANIFGSSKKENWEQLQAASLVPLNRIHPKISPHVAGVLQNPTLFTNGPAETFTCRPQTYVWFLDNPERAMLAWRRLGAKCVEIKRSGNGAFMWTDANGSKVIWSVVYRSNQLHVWYANGSVKPGKLLPMVPVQAVAVMRHDIVQQQKPGALMQHQASIFVHTDNNAAKLAMRLLGPAVPKMAKSAATQLQMFFAALSWYCHQNPDRARQLMQPPIANEPAASRVLDPFEKAQSQ